ncbi:UNVERIFIED_CONTAM: response regulator transcription factor [Halobacillus marinus]
MLSIIIAEDQTMLRSALRTLLSMEADFEVIGEAADGREALRLMETKRPDIALLDIEMPLMTGVEVLKEAKANGLETKVLILTTFSKRGYLEDAWKEKVDGYLLKDTPSEELADYIRQVMNGKQVISPELIHQMFTTEASPLNDREEEILRCVEKGCSTKQISESLYLSSGTVRNYLSEIMSKLDAQNRTEAAFIARRKGWLD